MTCGLQVRRVLTDNDRGDAQAGRVWSLRHPRASEHPVLTEKPSAHPGAVRRVASAQPCVTSARQPPRALLLRLALSTRGLTLAVGLVSKRLLES